MSLLRRMTGTAVLLFVAMMGLPAVAADENRGPGLKEYEGSLSKISVGDDPPNPQFWFHAGLLTGLHWAKEEYAKAKATPLFCLPANLQPVDLRDLILAELKTNGDIWRRTPGATVEKVALHVVRRKYPC